jgi:accessory gene regulator protein AgrB
MGLIIIPALIISGLTALLSFTKAHLNQDGAIAKSKMRFTILGLVLFISELFILVVSNINEGKVYAFAICFDSLMISIFQSLSSIALSFIKRDWTWKVRYILAISAILTTLLGLLDLVLPIANILGLKRTF